MVFPRTVTHTGSPYETLEMTRWVSNKIHSSSFSLLTWMGLHCSSNPIDVGTSEHQQRTPMSHSPQGKIRQMRRIRTCIVAATVLLCFYWLFFGSNTVLIERIQEFRTFVIVYSDDLSKRRDEATPKSGEPPILTFGIPLDWAEICEYLEREWTGSEGPIEDKEFRLRGISIAFRHGERSPLTTANAESACVPFREEDRREFAKYKELVESDDFQYFLHHDTKFANFSKLPSHSECFPRQMTAEGALQHVKLGKYIRSKYSASSIFSADSRLNVSITSSQFNRTFQSAIAFSSSFLFPSRISIPQIYIKASNFTFMCTSEKCRCDPAPKWRHQYEQEYYKYFQTRSPEHLRSFAKILKMQPAFNGSLDLFQIMDVALGRYICRRQTLPCFDGACLTLDYIGQLINETTIRGKVMYDEGDRYIARRLQLVEAYGVLYHIAETVGKLRKFPHTNVIQIFSGHDVMVAPLLRVMGIEFIDPPHYASRIVVEYYEAAGSSSTKHSILLRFIYNGVDITKKVNFCKTALKSKLCPAQLLEDFVQNKIFSSLGIASLKDICDSVST